MIKQFKLRVYIVEDYMSNIFQVGDFVRLAQDVLSSNEKDNTSQVGIWIAIVNW